MDQLLRRRFVFVVEPLRLKLELCLLINSRAMTARLPLSASPWRLFDSEVCRPSSLEIWVRWRCDRQQVVPFPKSDLAAERLYAVPCE
jgi:hypothetical protein